jgi:hypothetical protein
MSYLIFGVLTVALIALCLYFVLHRRPVIPEYSREPDGGALPSQTLEASKRPEKTREIPEKVTLEPPPRRQPQKVSKKQPEQPRETSLKDRAMPPRRARPEGRGKRSVPKHPSAVYPSQERALVRLCGGDPISQCTKVNFTQTGFAQLVLDILGLEVPGSDEEAFDILESLHIRPVDGWARAKPMERITLQEMEEVRCSISLAFEDGSISVGSSIVTAKVNRFCEAWEVSQRVSEDSGLLRADQPRLVETGYQGGGDDITSPAY